MTGFLSGGLCNNDADFSTLDAIADLNEDELLAVPHETNPDQSWCFNVNSLFALWGSGTPASFKNPWTNLPWTATQKQVILAKFAQQNLIMPNVTTDRQYMAQYFWKWPNTTMSERNTLLRAIKQSVNYGGNGFVSLQTHLNNVLPPASIQAMVLDKHYELVASNRDPNYAETGYLRFSYGIRVKSESTQERQLTLFKIAQGIASYFESIFNILAIAKFDSYTRAFHNLDIYEGFRPFQQATPKTFVEGLAVYKGSLGEAMMNYEIAGFGRFSSLGL